MITAKLSEILKSVYVRNNMGDCLFCKIVAGQLPSEKVFEDDDFLALKDIHPKAPTHVLVVPKKHIPSLADVSAEDEIMLGRLMHRVALVARDLGVADKGYKVVLNVREHGGQIVPHIHVHILGGERIKGLV